MDYNKYLQSDKWYQIRNKVLKRDDYECVKCGSSDNLHVHHLTYDNIGDEEIEDLITLCKKCHLDKHDNCKKTIDLIEKEARITNNKERRATLSNLRLGYNSFPNPLLKTSRLSSTDKEVYMHIVYLANVDTDKEHRLYGRCCRMSLSKISSQAHVSYPTLLKSLRQLEKYNVIAIDDDIKPWIICTRSILDWAI